MPSTPTVSISYAAICRSLSKERVAAYSLDTDLDSVDAVARYKWNLALAAAVTPTLHLAEVAFRNAIYNAGLEATTGRSLKYRQVGCWLDAAPTLLEPKEERDVTEALKHLGAKRRATPGHLVAQLGFGFWVRLCNRPYEHGRVSGPQLWPVALKRFPGCPKKFRTRTDIARAFSEVRDFRNLVAHHQPIWDRNPVASHSKALELLGWINPSLADIAKHLSNVDAVFAGGPSAYRAAAEPLLRC